MVQQRSRKTVRHFQCRDDLWSLYEKMAAELECSVDYLINEAMRQYARARRSGTIPPTRESIAPPGRPSMPAGRPVGGIASPPAGHSGIAPPPSGQRLAPPPRPGGSSSAPPQRPAPPQQQAPPQPARPSGPPATTQPISPPAMDTDPAAQRQAVQQRPQPAAQQPPAATAGTMPTLYLIFNGQKIPITKEQFIIGRGLKTSDLAIKDGNISRKHAAIIYHNGAYYIKDLGSVNGIEYGGKRIDSKRIDENDTFHICDYELRFTYH
jgi:hypothetical protein